MKGRVHMHVMDTVLMQVRLKFNQNQWVILTKYGCIKREQAISLTKSSLKVCNKTKIEVNMVIQ